MQVTFSDHRQKHSKVTIPSGGTDVQLNSDKLLSSCQVPLPLWNMGRACSDGQSLATKSSSKLHKAVPSLGLSELMLFWWSKRLSYTVEHQR